MVSSYSGIVNFNYIVCVTRDEKYSGLIINEYSQVVFMDEWTNDSLCCQDAKQIFKGNYKKKFLMIGYMSLS